MCLLCIVVRCVLESVARKLLIDLDICWDAAERYILFFQPLEVLHCRWDDLLLASFIVVVVALALLVVDRLGEHENIRGGLGF